MMLKAFIAAALLVLGITTAVALATPPPGSPAAAKLAAKAAKQRTSELKCRGGHMNLVGTVEAIDLTLSEFELTVLRSNRQGRALVGQKAKIVVGTQTRMRPKPKSGLDKLRLGDRIGVLVRKCRDAEGDAALLAKQVNVRGERTSTETSTTTTTP